MKKINYQFILILVLTAVIGLISGLAGSFLARAYLIKETFNLPMFNEVSITGDKLGSSNLIIREPKNVVVEQSVKMQETISSTKNSIVGIYKKKAIATSSESAKVLKISDYYLSSDQLGQGFILTSDGWLITNFISPELKTLLGKKSDNTKAINALLAKNYVIIGNDKKIYEIDNLISDKLSGFSFWHIKANGLPVKQFADASEISSGHQVIAVSNQGWSQPLNIIGHILNSGIEFSDGYTDELVLDEELSDIFLGSFLVNLNGNLAAVVDSNKRILSVQSFTGVFNNILKEQKAARPSLGVYYLSLDKLANYTDSKGAMIQKNKSGIAVIDDSPASKAGLKEGNVIVAVNNTEIDSNNSLIKIINSYQAGDEVEIKYITNQTTKTVKVKLGTLAN